MLDSDVIILRDVHQLSPGNHLYQMRICYHASQQQSPHVDFAQRRENAGAVSDSPKSYTHTEKHALCSILAQRYAGACVSCFKHRQQRQGPLWRRARTHIFSYVCGGTGAAHLRRERAWQGRTAIAVPSARMDRERHMSVAWWWG